ncbi:hypothetical protein ANCDUO_18969 [Ancylostoma duodenale]|uniref:Uncharacterized protein n=1 Tax=Ancylostoma duodenale TaxID=51022 RepID=A0A0C2FWF1_9BILA|nr:hypothetical protein ANCDUO_18969 [Ancylostoma duodenale]
MALRAVDSVWQRDGVSPLFFVNPALFLLPFLFNVMIALPHVITYCSSENNNLSRSFCAFNMSRRQLDTVHEEAESQESTLVSSTATDPSKIATRM